MKKLFQTILVLILSFLALTHLSAQKYASTQVEKKKAIIEEFTGVKCTYCPKGNAVASGIENSYPGNAFVVSYHPSSQNFCVPFEGDENLGRNWPVPILSYSGSNFMPSAMVNRRRFDEGLSLSRGLWEISALMIMTESSPCNVGFISKYDIETKTLTVDAEVYFTTAVEDNFTVTVVLMQDSIVTKQSGGGDHYVHKKTFREGLTDVWGDPITEETGKGALIERRYSFDNSSTNYNMERCSVLVFIRNNVNGEIITGNGGKANSALISLASSVPPYTTAGTGETSEIKCTLKNLSDNQQTIRLSASRSTRTPEDWTIDATGPTVQVTEMGVNVSLQAGATTELTLKITPGITTGVGDVILKAEGTASGQNSIKLTTISRNVEYLEIMESPSDNEPQSLNRIIKATGREPYLKFETAGLQYIHPLLQNLKVAHWSFNPNMFLSQVKASTITEMMEKGVRVLLTGTTPIGSLFTSDPDHQIFECLGITYDQENLIMPGSSYTFTGNPADDYFKSLSIPWTRDSLTDNLAIPVEIINSSVAAPILTIDNTNISIATKSHTVRSKAIVLHFNPYSINSPDDQEELIDRCLDWLEAPDETGPRLVFNPGKLDFGKVNQGNSVDRHLLITNSGNRPLVISKTELTGNDNAYFSIHSGNLTKTDTIPPDSSHIIILRFNPTSGTQDSKSYFSQLKITSNDKKSSVYNIRLTGLVIQGNVSVEAENPPQLEVQIHPNPVFSESVVEFRHNDALPIFVKALLIDVSGKVVDTVFNDIMAPGSTMCSFNTTNLASGSYFLIVKSQSGNLCVPIVINK